MNETPKHDHLQQQAEMIRKEHPLITHVAIRFQGKVWSLPKPNRHHDVIRMIAEQTGVDHVGASGDDQGFLDATGRYLRRCPALHLAHMNGQVKEGASIHGRLLFSEDLW
jgi:hypothetical protein